jgi:hypothetical protein
MPLTRIICPHCEQSVEVNMTSVTRSRECPNCGRTIMLQFTTQEKRQRRKALLMPTEAAETPSLEEVAPSAISGDLRERMMMDPEVRQRVKVIKISVAVIGAVLLIVVLGSVFHWWSSLASLVSDAFAHSRGDGTAAQQSGATPRAPVVNSPPAKTENPPASGTKGAPVVVAPDDEAAAIKIAVAFLKAADTNQRLGLILNVKTVEPKLRDYYLTHDPGPVPYENIESMGKDPALGGAFGFMVTLRSGERRRLVVRMSKKQAFLADWASFVIYSEMSWDDFLSARPQKPVMFRLWASAADQFGHGFADSEKLLCLKVTNPLNADSVPLYAYAPRSSSLGHSLEFVLRRAAGATVPLMLKLRFPQQDSSANQVWIDDFLGEGWVAQGW